MGFPHNLKCIPFYIISTLLWVQLIDGRFYELQERHFRNIPNELHDAKHGVKMGIANEDCDDAKHNLDVDWDGNPANFTCFDSRKRFPLVKKRSLLECEHISEGYSPQHYCMNQKIIYDTPFPTHASHRPLWAQFGEYVFLPPQRWSHNVEHGAVVMLYHPCTDPNLLKKLKKIVKGCIRKHVITASNMTPENYPMVLVAWGCRMFLNGVNENEVKTFIKKYGLTGPEGKYPKDGQYNHMLLKEADIPKGSTIEDAVLCP